MSAHADLEQRLRESLRTRASTFALARPDQPLDYIGLPRRSGSHRWAMTAGAAAVAIAVAVTLFSVIGNHPVGHHHTLASDPPVRAPSPTPPPTLRPCPAGVTAPTNMNGQYCGPVPPAGNGLGADGVCTGQETTAPCGAGVTIGLYYAYTVPGQCDGLVIFDGRAWVSKLPPPAPVPDMHVWMRLSADGTLGFIGPTGMVGFTPYTGQALNECSASTTSPT